MIRPWGPVAFDWITIVSVRAGTLMLTVGSPDSKTQVALGESSALVVRPERELVLEPEGSAQVSMLWLDQDWLVGTVRSLGPVALPAWLRDLHDLPILDRHPDGWVQVRGLTPGAPDVVTSLVDSLMMPEAEHQWPASSQHLGAEGIVTGFGQVGVVFDALGVVDAQLPHVTAGLTPGSVAGTPPRPRRPIPLRAEVRAVAARLRAHPEREWRLPTLAGEVGLSTKQLQRIFVQAYGLTPAVFLARLRVELMARQLVNTNEPVVSILAGSGWAGRAFATAQFHTLTGLAPSDYRRRYQARRPAAYGSSTDSVAEHCEE